MRKKDLHVSTDDVLASREGADGSPLPVLYS